MAKVQEIDRDRLEGPLASIPSPPPLLRCVGDVSLLGRKGVAIVGTRRPSDVETQLSHQLGEALAKRGEVVVSGLALGIDGAAHRGALSAGGLTVAFLGCGLGKISPASHRPLARQIYEGAGLLASEQENYQEARPQHLIARNRLISGLAKAVIVIASGIDGGTMHTVRFAFEQGRAVYCPDSAGVGGDGVRLLLSTPAPEVALRSKALKPLAKRELGEEPLATGFEPSAAGIEALLAELSEIQASDN